MIDAASLLSTAGMYTSASEVIHEALRLMEEQDRLRQAKLEELRREVRAGLDSGASEPWDAAALKQKARVRQTARARAASVARVTRRPKAEDGILEI